MNQAEQSASCNVSKLYGYKSNVYELTPFINVSIALQGHLLHPKTL